MSSPAGAWPICSSTPRCGGAGRGFEGTRPGAAGAPDMAAVGGGTGAGGGVSALPGSGATWARLV
ncbi:hypothetical protein [Dankookia sp. P2]|uniref:hypothetical protein n=1 Tax=Dankookia sp. P2 TaxID=3423955 RepID=UPI003D6797BF